MSWLTLVIFHHILHKWRPPSLHGVSHVTESRSLFGLRSPTLRGRRLKTSEAAKSVAASFLQGAHKNQFRLISVILSVVHEFDCLTRIPHLAS